MELEQYMKICLKFLKRENENLRKCLVRIVFQKDVFCL